MFTGIVTDIGHVRKIEMRGDTHVVIGTSRALSDLDIGASMACAGVCLTVTKKGKDWFAVTASAETLSKTNLGGWRKGTPVNLERSMHMGDEIGGHIVTGHIDGTARITAIKDEGESVRMTFSVPKALAKFIAAKGSVALDGVSLTVNEAGATSFGVNLIPHTLAVTTLGKAKVGDKINLEIDLLARYVERLVRG